MLFFFPLRLRHLKSVKLKILRWNANGFPRRCDLRRFAVSVPACAKLTPGQNRATGLPAAAAAEAAEDVHKIRNIGIMAHIDAGKTTTTERMLYYSGFTKHLGDVDDGDTVTDYMEQERERGITITSAAVTFRWNQHKINLIDTPGHVDFTLEVERCLRVLDGAITVLDASAGVEAQTLTVWRQADRYAIPRLVFINKMDSGGADLPASLKSLKTRLGATPLLLQTPIYAPTGGRSGSGFTGVVEIISMKAHVWDLARFEDDRGKSFLTETPTGEVMRDALVARTRLIEQLAEMDDAIGESFMRDEQISASSLADAVRRQTLCAGGTASAVPVLCGASLRGVGVQPLLDAVIAYLPHPNEGRQHDFVAHYGGAFVALAFKIVHDRRLGALTYVRVYSGRLRRGEGVWNAGRGCVERPGKMYEVRADEVREVQGVGPGEIVALSGLKQTVTGDTLVASEQSAKSAARAFRRQSTASSTLPQSQNSSSTPSTSSSAIPAICPAEFDPEELEQDCVVLAGVPVPSPVMFCAVEPPSLGQQGALDAALACLLREDPSLSLSVEGGVGGGQAVLGGMGSLHLDIVKDRILKEYGVDADFGPIQIAYRESIATSASDSSRLDRTIGSTRHLVTLALSVRPGGATAAEGDKPAWGVEPEKDSEFAERLPLKRHVAKAVESGISSGLSRGPSLGSPVINVSVAIHDLKVGGATSAPMISACVAQCVRQAVAKATPTLLEPIVSLEIHTDESKLGAILSDLSQRRAHIHDVVTPLPHPSGRRSSTKVVMATAPLAELADYASALRTRSSGLASVSMRVAGYERMGEEARRKLVYSQTGLMR